MGKIVTGVTVGVAIWATGTSAWLYSDLHPGWWRATPAKVAVPIAPQASPTAHVQDRTIEREAAQAKAMATIRAAVDEFLTGDPNGHAEWKAPDYEAFPIICGVTPQGRYFIKINQYGLSRHDESPTSGDANFIDAWNHTGCSKTSPVNQSYLIRKQLEEEEYDRTHPINTQCLFAKADASVRGDTETEKLWSDDPHYCQNGHYERDQAAKTGSLTATQGR